MESKFELTLMIPENDIFWDKDIELLTKESEAFLEFSQSHLKIISTDLPDIDLFLQDIGMASLSKLSNHSPTKPKNDRPCIFL